MCVNNPVIPKEKSNHMNAPHRTSFGKRFLQAKYCKDLLRRFLNLAVLFTAVAMTGSAATFVVTKTADTDDGVCDSDCSLREAIVAANAAPTDDVIEFAIEAELPIEIILSNGELEVLNGGKLDIHGSGRESMVISGNAKSRIFSFRVGSVASIRDMTLTNGNGEGSFNTGFGGAIYFDGSSLKLSNLLISHNSSDQGGGMYGQSGTVTIDGCEFTFNVATYNGGALMNQENGTFVVSRTSAVENTSRSAAFDNRGSFSASKVKADSNHSRGFINLRTGIATLIDATISNNLGRNMEQGGGVENVGDLTIISSTINGNSTQLTGTGGGIHNVGDLHLVNVTVSGNQGWTGGGISNSQNLWMDHVTVTRNIAAAPYDRAGGVDNMISGTLTLRNSLIANNTTNNGLSPDCLGTFESEGFNLIGNSDGVIIKGETGSDIVDVDPLIDPILRNNGGETLTHSLSISSPAIDKGGASEPVLKTDQRGNARPFDFQNIPDQASGNGSDIGAFELQNTDLIGTPFDFDGDGKTDASIFRPAGGEWWWQPSSGGLAGAAQFGSGTDIITPGDFTGDGKADSAVFRPSTGQWFILKSEDFSYYAFPFGAAGDIPIAADMDGDGKADPVIFRPSTGVWYTMRSSDLQITTSIFGGAGDVPAVADYDGDGKDDVAVFRPNGASGAEWWYVQSSDGLLRAFSFGMAGDKAVPGDYTGDGKADVAFYRPSTGQWFVLQSEDFGYYAFPFGAAGDIPVPGDYDGDGRFDAAVFRPSDGNWYVNGSTAGVMIQHFGGSGDLPVPNAYVH